MVRIVVSVLGLVSAAILLFLAWMGWARKLRGELPAWRNALSFSALVLLSLNWVAVAVLEAPVFVNAGVTRPVALIQAMLTLSHPLGVVVVVLAFALRSVPRIQAVIAGLLMLLSWPLGYTRVAPMPGAPSFARCDAKGG